MLLLLSVVVVVVVRCCCLLSVKLSVSIPPNFSANLDSDGLEDSFSGMAVHHHFPIFLKNNLMHSRCNYGDWACPLKSLFPIAYRKKRFKWAISVSIKEDILILDPSIFFLRNEGQLRPPITRPKTPSTPLWHTYSEPPGHQDSAGTIYKIPCL